MKKIIALLLALCCLFAVVSCNDNNTDGDGSGNGDGSGDNSVLDGAAGEQMKAVLEMFDDSIPTRSDTTTTQTIGGNVVLESTASLVTGTIEGKAVSVYNGSYSSLREVGNTLNMTAPQTESKWYVEGKGVTDDKGATWDAEADDFAPKEGFIRLNLSAEMVYEAVYDEVYESLLLKIKKEHATSVIGAYLEEGQTIDSDIEVTVVTAGGRITGIKLAYTVPKHEISVDDSDAKIEVQETKVVIDAKYQYNHQKINLG